MELDEIYKKYPWLNENYTVGNIYNPMINAVIGKQPDIDPLDYFEAVVTILVKLYNYEPLVAVNEVKHNIGYYAGYFNMSTMEKVKEVYGAVHPVFG